MALDCCGSSSTLWINLCVRVSLSPANTWYRTVVDLRRGYHICYVMFLRLILLRSWISSWVVPFKVVSHRPYHGSCNAQCKQISRSFTEGRTLVTEKRNGIHMHWEDLNSSYSIANNNNLPNHHRLPDRFFALQRTPDPTVGSSGKYRCIHLAAKPPANTSTTMDSKRSEL